MIAAIVPAAGLSRRMGVGVQKLLLPLAGKPIVAHVVDSLIGLVELVVVVTRQDDSKIATALIGRRLTLTLNPDPDGDMLSSIRAGLHALPPGCTGVLVAPGDQPHIPTSVIDRLIAAFSAKPNRIIVPVHEGRRGHPLLFPAALREEVLTRFDGDGLRGLLQAHPSEVMEISVESSGVIEDVDLMSDFERLKSGAHGR